MLLPPSQLPQLGCLFVPLVQVNNWAADRRCDFWSSRLAHELYILYIFMVINGIMFVYIVENMLLDMLRVLWECVFPPWVFEQSFH